MKLPVRKRRTPAANILLLGVALAVFASPFTVSWAGFRPPWLMPYLLWGCLIALTALLSGSDSDNDH